MPERIDFPALVAGHTVVIEMINSGDTGLPVLTQLLRVAQSALDAAGMAFVEFAPTGGRVIAATGAAEWTIGRPLPVDDPATACLLSGPRVQQVRTDHLNGKLAAELAGRDLVRMVVSRAEIGGLTVGSLHALYPDHGEEPDAGQHDVIGYLASCIAHMYGDQSGLPVHGDGPVVAALADGLAVVDRDSRVRLWNPAAAQVTGRAAAQALNQPLPFPLPPSGQVLDHRLPDGRWLRITSGELPGPGVLRVVTFRDITDQQRRDHDRDLFVAVTSHELRTPVTVIKGYADTLTDHWESLTETDRRQAARVIGQRANELARLVDRGRAGRGPARALRPRRRPAVGGHRPACGPAPPDRGGPAGRPAQGARPPAVAGHRADRAEHERRQVLPGGHPDRRHRRQRRADRLLPGQ